MKVFKTNNMRVHVKSWATDLDDTTLRQITNAANIPAVFHHVALMPDAHGGYGVPIGSVVALKNAVSPAMVGMDIACFIGNTKIPLLDGSMHTLKNLAFRKDSFWVYSVDKDGMIAPGWARALKTKENAELVKVCISGGEEIVCTPEHEFMLRDGTYKEANKLKTNDSLMPLYRKYQTRDGYESILNPGGRIRTTHKHIYERIFERLPDGYVVHHENGNRWDNTPENLMAMAAAEHSRLHALEDKSIDRLRSDKFKAHRLKVLREKGFYAEEFAEKKKEIATANIKKYMDESPEDFAKVCVKNGERGKEYLIAYNKSEKGRAKSREIGTLVQSRWCECKICGEKIQGTFRMSRHMKKMHSNHKVISVTEIKRREDVYCLQVNKYHNFALAAGVFVHNCGMCAAPTYASDLDMETVKEIIGGLREVIPVGFKHHNKPQAEVIRICSLSEIPIVASQYESARKQIGTLGSGNHFISIERGSDNQVWIMIHSGSRNVGYKVAKHYMKLATKLNNQWYTDSGLINGTWYPSKLAKNELAILPIGTREAESYLKEMNWCLEFAKANRRLMAERAAEVFTEITGYEVELTAMIDIHHNYAVIEHHFNNDVWVHRKGATLARKGTLGIIPGSQGTHSYIVKGKGNPDSFHSCSHGAGRKMGRKQAKRELILAEEQAKMMEIVHSVRHFDDLDEAPGAYKDIEEVMAAQEDLVEIIVTLTPLGVLKG